ncbi:hypothetical protein J5N97_014634 [Dioscorea zingiberensis]|uniref:ATP-dependent DNA helicase n=1 Tax=Dioscorea zingiberensis TaxID=325984 RepID=A0A9D5CSS3_9LILI|nr:hypothetical protein J5N97_014634 [Dioscorea zingiberensis]
MESVLKKYFGYSQFRPYQKEIIDKILSGRDCLVVMATGSGKSLCYQIPPLVKGKTAVVISPLLSLMQDQVMSLKQRGVKAEYLGSTQTKHAAYSEAENGIFDVLYMTPEKACLLPPSFWKNLLNAGICLLAVDEAHCISEWGHDFRKEYKQLHLLRGVLSDVPFVGLTATATEKVQKDIVCSLKMKDTYIAIGSFDRPNLFYGVKCSSRSMSFVDELVVEVSKYISSAGSTIIYCTTVKDTEQICDSLKDAGIKAGMYHGQMGSKARDESHRSFIRDDLHVMVATIAFGMGIDKPNIRCVIHYGCPKSLESYYQESGRCGRDGLASICWLYYARSDFAKADFYCADASSENQRKAIMESLMAAEKYCYLSTCRRKFLLEYFGEETAEDCGNCDNCTRTREERDLSREAYLLLSCVQSCAGRWGLNMPIDILRGSRSKKILENNFDKVPMHGMGKNYSSTWWKALAGLLFSHGFLKEVIRDVYRFASVSPSGLQFLSNANTVHQGSLILPLNSEMIDEERSGNSQTKVEGNLQNLAALEREVLSEAEEKLYHMLLDVRKRLAQDFGTAPYAICGDQTIRNIAKIRPSNKARLANIDGVNQHLVTKYGDSFLQSIGHLSQEVNLSLDGEAPAQPSVTKEYPYSQRKLTPAKFDAWRLWEKDQLSFHHIASLPRKSGSGAVKEQTIISYILDAAREGHELNWTRFCKEIGLTLEIVQQIGFVITKIGSKDRLKPIKEELPESVSYDHIRAYLIMEDLNVPMGELFDLKSCTPDEVPTKISGSLSYDHEGEKEKGCYATDNATSFSQERISPPSPLTPFSLGSVSRMKQPRSDDSSIDNSAVKKLHKCSETKDECNDPLVATESAILEWVANQDGVSSSNIIEHFKGSRRESIIELLDHLEEVRLGEIILF